ncbi:SDR family NAD(P)-dependent oxidoreductase [Rhodococcus jostii]|uniref:SDR family NAD(P)-dependent oxidoreductase n=1 Tax=Rhodococcus jostii TaxID=132919 RepID=UPI0036352069
MTAETPDRLDDRRLARNPIAIVGMSGLFPKARNHREYWQNIVDGIDCTEDVPESRWSLDDYYDEDRTAPDKTYSRRGAFLPDIDFDPLEFGLPPNQLEVTSTMQTLSLGVARDLLTDAGAPDSTWYDPARTGVVLGTTGPVPLMHPLAARLSTPVLKEVARSCGLSDTDANVLADKFVTAFAPWEENSFPGLLANVVAGRIANRFGLGGINCTVDAACAASLAAMRTAIAELLDGRADTMITGGVDTENSIFIYMCFSKVGALSPTGRISPFSDQANGTILGEGISMLALRRLDDAERDGNRIYAVIKGLGSSSDGRSKSIYAPRAEGQRVALDRAYTDADCSPGSVELFEAHATGTAVGDRTELTALGGLLADASDEPRFAALGSVKSQIGHTKGAAGTASVMKLALGLYHRVLPGTINVDKPNPAIDTAAAPYYVNTRTRPWIRDPERPVRRAAASAMGFGGTNFHVVLEEHANPTADRRTLHTAPTAHLWHAPDATALIDLVRTQPSQDGGQIPTDHVRIGVVSLDEDNETHLRELAADQLTKNPDAEAWNHPEGIFYRASAQPDLRIGALFSGQGSQYVDMGTAAALANPLLADTFDRANAAFAGEPQRLGAVVFPPPVFDDNDRDAQETLLRRTEFAQPAIGALSAGQFRALTELGFTADGYLGHSFGELTALWAAGSLTTDDFFALARARGQAMAPQPGAETGTMLAVAATRDDVDALITSLDDVWVCNHNAPDQIVVGGGTEAVAAFARTCADRGVATRALPVSAAFHTPYVGHAVTAFEPAVAEVRIGEPAAPVYANSPGAHYGTDVDTNRATLVGQLLQPVEFVTALERMRQDGCTVFVEFGPKQVLTSLVRRTLGDDVVAIATDGGPLGDSDLSLKRAAVQLAVLGLALDGINRYRDVPLTPVERRGMSVSLSAPEHTPEQRRRAYADALGDGYRVSPVSAPTASIPEPTATHPAPLPIPPAPPATAPTPLPIRTTENTVSHPAGPSTGLDTALSQHVATHNDYLDGQLELARELARALNTAQLDDGMVRAIEAVKDHGVAISHTHARATEILGHLAELDTPATTGTTVAVSSRVDLPALPTRPTPQLEPIPTPAAAPAPTPIPAPVSAPAPPAPSTPATLTAPIAADSPAASAAVDAAALRTALQEVVADKTGYPVEMVDPSMDLEADLGVDSIKRVQVLGAVQERFPHLPSLGPEQLGTLRTLDQIVDLLADAPAEAEPTAPPTAPTNSPSAGVDAAALRTALQEVVADKTGYPVEMVDPSMDLEADLGVDSIKRVQVLGAVQERFPHLPSLGPEQLGTLRTLDQIVDLLAEGSDVHPKAEAAATAPRHLVELVALPPIDHQDNTFGDHPHAVIIELGPDQDNSDGAALAHALTNHHWTVRRLHLTGTLDEIDTTLTDTLDGRTDLCVVTVGYTHDWSDATRALGATILAAKHTHPALLNTARTGTRAAFVTVTRIDGALGFVGDGDPVGALAGGIGGVVKTLGVEHPELFSRALDIHPALDGDRFTAAILAELHDSAVDTPEVGVGELGDRQTLVPGIHAGSAEQTSVRLDTPVEITALTADDIVLVTGGARGVTALCVRDLARHCDARFILLGRTELVPEPQWAHGVEDQDLRRAAIVGLGGTATTPREIARTCAAITANREIQDTLTVLGERGRYIAADVTDTAAIEAALGADRDHITALVHGAGVLADALITKKTAGEIARVLSPKIGGLAAVLGALGETPQLRHLVFFTSVAGLYGNSGQADYAAANEALGRFAATWKHRHPDHHVTAIDWGAWDGGMVTPELRGYFLDRGITLLDPDVGARAFTEQFTTARRDDVVILIGEAKSLATGEPTHRPDTLVRRSLRDLPAHRIIAAHRIGEHTVLPATFGLGAMINVVERAHPGLCVTTVRDFRVHKGIIFDHPITDVSIETTHTAATEPVRVHVQVFGTENDRRVPHYAATLELSTTPDSAPAVPVTWPATGADAEILYRDATQFHAPPLQGMRRILRDDADALVLECALSGAPVALGAFTGVLHNPVLADVILQGPPVAGHRALGSACLPLGIGHIDYYDALPDDEPFVLIVDNARPGPVDALVDACAVTANGTVLQRFTDVVVVTTPDLSEKFRESVRQWSE